jgi:hypothetical protein
LVPISIGQTGYGNADDNDCADESAKPKSHRLILSSLTAASASNHFMHWQHVVCGDDHGQHDLRFAAPISPCGSSTQQPVSDKSSII